MSNQNLKLLFEHYQEKPIAYNRIYSKITGSVVAGLVLSQIVYWDKVMKHEEFYKTDDDFCEELAIGLYELKSAKTKLQSLKIIDIKRKGIPAKTHYKLDIEYLIKTIIEFEDSEQVLGKTHNLSKEKPRTNNVTEINTEIIIPPLAEPPTVVKNSFSSPSTSNLEDGNMSRIEPKDIKLSEFEECWLFFKQCCKKYHQIEPMMTRQGQDGKRLSEALKKLKIKQVKDIIDWYLDESGNSKRLGCNLSIALSASIMNQYYAQTGLKPALKIKN